MLCIPFDGLRIVYRWLYRRCWTKSDYDGLNSFFIPPSASIIFPCFFICINFASLLNNLNIWISFSCCWFCVQPSHVKRCRLLTLRILFLQAVVLSKNSFFLYRCWLYCILLLVKVLNNFKDGQVGPNEFEEVTNVLEHVYDTNILARDLLKKAQNVCPGITTL